MIQIRDTILSSEIFEQHFACNYEKCKGVCCVDGDGGAPLAEGEGDKIRSLLPLLRPLLSDEACAVIETEGVSYRDEDGDEVTSLVNGEECVFSCYDNRGACFCAIERLARDGKTDFIKPLSCHLYPIRLTHYTSFIALNYHRRSICKAAVKLGKYTDTRVYRFLREPLIRAFGEDWYAEVEEVATLLNTEKTV